jgi:hypothetical protein
MVLNERREKQIQKANTNAKATAGPSTRPGAPGLAQDDMRLLSLRMTGDCCRSGRHATTVAQEGNFGVMTALLRCEIPVRLFVPLFPRSPWSLLSQETEEAAL